MYKKYIQKEKEAHIIQKNEIVKIMPITQNLDTILQQENIIQKMEQLLWQLPMKIEKKKEKIKKVNKINLRILKHQLEDWKYYGAHYKKYSKINKEDDVEIIGEEELKEELINTETYKRYLRLRRVKKARRIKEKEVAFKGGKHECRIYCK